MEPLWDHEGEFPRLDPRYDGRQHGHVFLSHDSGEHVLAKLDVDGGRVDAWMLPDTQFPSEIVMVPRSASAPEGDGYAMSLVYDEEADRSHVIILDTARFEEGPIATIYLEHHVPMTFHGVWLPEKPSV